MKKSIISSISILAFLLNFLTYAHGKNFDESFKIVKTEINRNNIKEAIKILGDIKIENESQKEKIDLLFGDIYLKINKPKKAIEFYENALMTTDDKIESLGELGLSESALIQGKLSKAIEHAERSLALNEDSVRCKIVLAMAITRNGEKDKALQMLENLYQNYRNNSEVNLAIAGYHSSFDNYKEAIKILEKYLKSFPTTISVMDDLADLYWIDGNKDQALDLKYKVYKYHEFNRNKVKLKEIKEWILSIDPNYFEKQKPKPIAKKKKKKYQEEEVEEYNERNKEIQYEKFNFAYNFTGSGFIVGKGKYVVTNNHVIEGARKIAVRNGLGKIAKAEVVAISKDYDLAILKLNRNYKHHISPKRFAIPVAGQEVISIGYPMSGYFGNDLPVITQGIVSKVYDDKIGIFLTTTDINSGNSGGPIFDMNGYLVGVSVATLDKAKVLKETGQIPTSMGFGIKSNMLKNVFKYKATIPTRNIKYNKSKIYEEMLSKVVFVAVEADEKTKIKKKR